MPHRRVTNCRLEYQSMQYDSMDMELGWDILIDDYVGRSFKPDSLTDGLPGRFRVVCGNEVGETVGPVVEIPAIGHSKTETRLPVGWYDDPPRGAGPLWTTLQTYRRTRDGRGYYTYDRSEMSEVSTQEEIDGVVPWVEEGAYDAGERVTTSVASIDTVQQTVVFIRLYQCTTTHLTTSTDDGPTVNAKGYWDFLGIYNVTYTDPTPQAPTLEDENDVGITVRHTIAMNRMEIAQHRFSSIDRPEGPGEYKLVTRNETGVVPLNTWDDITGHLNLIAMSLVDKDGANWTYFHESLGGDIANRTHYVVIRYSTGKWIRCIIERVWFSQNGLRCNLTVTLDGIRQEDNTDDIPQAYYVDETDESTKTFATVDADFLFDIAPPTIM